MQPLRRLWRRDSAVPEPGGADPADVRKPPEPANYGAVLAQRDLAIQTLREQVAQLEKIIASRDEGIRFLRLELARLSREPQEQRDWWDTQFADAWERNAGPAQSRHFMQRLIANIQARERRFLSSQPLRILDWGCATGDGLNELAKAFPVCKAFGIDLSQVAIEKARLKYPGLTFMATERGTFEDSFDVIVTSNCLEHFDAPLEWLDHLLQASRWLVMVLVPYKEEQLIEGHKVSFSADSFPQVFRGFTRLQADAIDVDRAFWAGKQLLAVYASQRYVEEVLPARGAGS